MKQKPNFAVRVMVFKNGKILLGKNKRLVTTGKYGFPGGHVEYMESFKDCAKRELLEECNIEIDNIKFLCIYNITDDKPFHNINITLTADWKERELKVMEPEKTESWNWYDIENPPQPLFKNVELSLKSYKNGENYFDIEDTK